MGYIQGEARDQLILFPESLDDYITAENPVRVMDAFVNNLDLVSLGFTKSIPAREGRPPYAPTDLLKLYIYGYFNKVRSSRRLMTECGRNLELMWLVRKLVPDFRTIADFRKDNVKPLKQVFRQFTKLCLELNLFGKELLSIDGSKFKAVNSKDNNFTIDKLKDRLENIQQNIDKYLKELDENDNAEKKVEREYSKEELEEKIKVLTERQQRYNGYLAEMKETGNTQKSLTDPEARLMKNNGKLEVCYNVQTAVDSKNHLIADFEVTNNCCDFGLLTDVAVSAKKELCADSIEVVADMGYRCNEDVLDCLLKGAMPNVPPQDGKDAYEFELPYEDLEITDEIKNSAKPEDIEKCIKAGVIPNIYENNPNISIEKVTVTTEKRIKNEEYVIEEPKPPEEIIQIKEVERFVVPPEGHFIRDLEKDVVVCPKGEILRRKAFYKNRNMTRYCNVAACIACTEKCTSSRAKEVNFKEGQTHLACKFYGGRKKIQKEIKKVKNQVIKRKKVITYETVEIPKKTVVKILLRPNREHLKNRKCLSEHPFGTVKHYNDSGYMLTKGSEKTTGELSLSFLAYNLKRALNVIGAQGIISKLLTV